MVEAGLDYLSMELLLYTTFLSLVLLLRLDESGKHGELLLVKKPIFTVDWENWSDALHIAGDNRIEEPTFFLLDLLDKYKVKAIFFILGKTADENPEMVEEIESSGHILGSHGYYHYHNEASDEPLYRSPYWDITPMPWPPSGGFFFRAMPLIYVKYSLHKSGIFWIHPHDIDLGHPKVSNLWLNWKRHVGLKTARKKLERLLQEVSFDDSSSYFG